MPIPPESLYSSLLTPYRHQLSHSCYRVYQIDYTSRGLEPITSLTVTENCARNSMTYFSTTTYLAAGTGLALKIGSG